MIEKDQVHVARTEANGSSEPRRAEAKKPGSTARKRRSSDPAAAAIMYATNHRVNRLLAAMSREDFARLEPHLESMALPRGTILEDSGEVIRHAYFPHDRIISLVAVLKDGNSVEMAVFGRDGARLRGATPSYRVPPSADGRHRATARLGVADCLRAAAGGGQHMPRMRKLLLQFKVEALLAQTRPWRNAVHSVEACCSRWSRVL